MKPLDFNTLDKLNQSDPAKELTRQAQESIKAMQVDVPQVGIPSHVVLPVFQKADHNQYVVTIDGAAQGPFTIQQLNEMIRQRVITPESYVWRSGMSDWRMIKECQDILK